MVSINGQLGLSGTIPSLPALIGRILFGLTTSKLMLFLFFVHLFYTEKIRSC